MEINVYVYCVLILKVTSFKNNEVLFSIFTSSTKDELISVIID